MVGGWKVLDGDETARTTTVSPAYTFPEEYVGGGTWRYGTYKDSNYVKHCWSHYWNPSRKHSATARMNYTVRKEANAGNWAYAEPTPIPVNIAGPCSVYWGLL